MPKIWAAIMEMNGIALPVWDYRVPGVTSISADLHKYGFAAKGASTITYRHLELMKHQMFVQADWPGGVFASPALLGTRPGGAYAAAWAALQHFGVDGYRELASRTSQAFENHHVFAQPAILAFERAYLRRQLLLRSALDLQAAVRRIRLLPDTGKFGLKSRHPLAQHRHLRLHA